MPMYDWNGTTGSELGKVYDWDGTTSHQLGKGYDWDGTTNNLIYSAEETLYPNGSYTPTSYSGKMNGGSASGFKITMTSGLNVNANRYIGAIDLSKYKSIQIGYTVSNINGTESYPTIALVTNLDFWAVYACNTDSPTVSNVISSCHKRIKTNGSATITFDVSSLSSSVYVWEGLWKNTSGSGGGTIEITSVIAEPV